MDAALSMMTNTRNSRQKNTRYELPRPLWPQITALQDAIKLTGYHDLLYIKENHHAAFEALATMLLLDMAQTGTPNAVHLSTTFLRLYGAALWPDLHAHRNHLKTRMREERYQQYWRTVDATTPAAVDGPIFSAHANITRPIYGPLLPQQPDELQYRLPQLLWRYFEHLIEIGRRARLQERCPVNGFTLLASFTEYEALRRITMRDD